MSYNVGTVNIVAGAQEVAGNDTEWVGEIQVGDVFVAPDGRSYGVASVVSDTALTIDVPYLGQSVTNGTYVITPSVEGTPTVSVAVLVQQAEDAAAAAALSAEGAGDSAAAAADALADGLEAKGDAETAAAAAALSAAEAAATANGVIYPNTAAGIAAVADGEYFVVAGDGTSSYALLYQRSGASATLVATYPSRDGVVASFAIAGLTALYWGSISGAAVTATTSASINTISFASGSITGIVMGAANPANMTLAINGGSALPVRDADGTELTAALIPSGVFVTLRRYTTPDNHWRVVDVSILASLLKSLREFPTKGMRARGILANGASVAGQTVPGVYRLSSGGGYTGLPTGYPTGSAGMLFVYDPGDASGSGAATHIMQEVMSQVPVTTGAAQNYHPRWMRRAAVATPTTITGTEAWTPITPIDPYLGNMARSRGAIANATDLNTIWENGIYQGANASTYSGRPSGFSSGAFELIVTDYGSTGGFGQGRFVRQVMTALNVTNPGTAQAYRKQYERIIDTTAPSSAGNDYVWIARHATGGAYTGRTAVVLGDSIVQGETSFDFIPLLAAATGMTVVNGGFGGCRMGEHPTDANRDALGFYRLADYIASGTWTAAIDAAAALQAIDGNALRPAHAAALAALTWSSVDYIIVMFGTNDFTGPVPIGNAGDSSGTTFKGAMNYGIETILSAFPKAKLIFCTPMWRARVNGSAPGGTYSPPGGVIDDSNLTPNSVGDYLFEYGDAIVERAEAHQLPVIDMYHNGGINTYNWEAYIPDGLHPTANTDGITLMAERVAAGLRAVV